jgi:hypothetical protein
MRHWMDPTLRGVYDHPDARPPPPRPPYHNDINARVSKLEVQAQFSQSNAMRIEAESRLRAQDLGEAVRMQGEGLKEVLATLAIFEQERHTRRAIWRLLRTFARSVGAFARWAAAVILAVLFVSGKLSLEALRLLLGALGLPTG